MSHDAALGQPQAHPQNGDENALGPEQSQHEDGRGDALSSHDGHDESALSSRPIQCHGAYEYTAPCPQQTQPEGSQRHHLVAEVQRLGRVLKSCCFKRQSLPASRIENVQDLLCRALIIGIQKHIPVYGRCVV